MKHKCLTHDVELLTFDINMVVEIIWAYLVDKFESDESRLLINVMLCYFYENICLSFEMDELIEMTNKCSHKNSKA